MGRGGLLEQAHAAIGETASRPSRLMTCSELLSTALRGCFRGGDCAVLVFLRFFTDRSKPPVVTLMTILVVVKHVNVDLLLSAFVFLGGEGIECV